MIKEKTDMSLKTNELNTLIETAKKEKSVVSSELETTKQQLQKSTTIVNAQQAEIQSLKQLKQENDELKAKYNSLLDEMRQKVEKLSIAAEQFRTENTTLKNQAQTTEQNYKNTLFMNQEKVREIENKLAYKETELNRLTQELESQLKIVHNTHSVVSDLNRNLIDSKNDLNRTQMMYEQKKQETLALLNEVNEKSKNLHDLETKNNSLSMEIEKLKSNYEKTTASSASSSEELTKIKNLYEQIKKNFDEISSKSKETQDILKNKETELEVVNTKLEKNEIQMISLKTV